MLALLLLLLLGIGAAGGALWWRGRGGDSSAQDGSSNRQGDAANAVGTLCSDDDDPKYLEQLEFGPPIEVEFQRRFLDRLERREGEWRILERAAIYEQDRLDTVEPSTAFGMVMRASSADDYPEPYRYMALRLASAGRALAEPVHHDGSAPTRELYARYEAWFASA